ncbi:MAG: hypothetical protein SGPRY_011224 [Prymnesium sp.]
MDPGAARETILALLSQRAVQTQLFFCREFKNDHLKKWLERFAAERGAPPLCQSSGQMLHSADAMLTMKHEAFLLDMMGSPDEEHEVEVVWGNRFRSGSPENPYLQDRKPTTYTDVVSPAKEDVRLITRDNDELRRHHAEEVRSLTDEQARFQHAIQPGMTGGDSPLRESSFDLLKTAATRCAARRLFRELDGDLLQVSLAIARRLWRSPLTNIASLLQRHSAEWLRIFDKSRDSPLRGNHGWHAGRKYILDLMAQPVSVSTSPGGNARFLDPLMFAERVLDIRAEIALEWAEILQEVKIVLIATSPSM